ncbi:MAG TPA: hypothetical protein PLK37_08830 [Terricaulis sp.]|nr:hypothetical protein [Terricaulis sp.]
MSLLERFGVRRRRRWVIDSPPENVDWRPVRPRANQTPVRARRAEADCIVETRGGQLRARGGRDFIVTYDHGGQAVVRGDIFERSYEPLGDGRFRKRTDVIFHAFELDRPAIVHTLEGPQSAEPGDWVVEGVAGELWPVPRAEAVKKYDDA